MQHFFFFFKINSSLLGLWLKDNQRVSKLKDNTLIRPRGPTVWLRDSMKHTLHIFQWFPVSLNTTLVSNLFEFLTKFCTVIPLDFFSRSYTFLTVLKSHLLVFLSFSMWRGWNFSKLSIPVHLCLTVLPSMCVSSLTFYHKQQEETKPNLQHFAWKSP